MKKIGLGIAILLFAYTVSLWWGDELQDKNSQPEMARKLGLDIDYVHAPCNNPNDLWIDGLKINLALENLDSIQHLDYIYENIKSEYLGFCYDSGHEYFNHRDADCLSRYGNKLFAVHLDDNCGDDDTHLLPYDGEINWDIIKQKLNIGRSARFSAVSFGTTAFTQERCIEWQ